jgi:ubiquinone/menaquinone biosynthesis C-methylase UbiE
MRPGTQLRWHALKPFFIHEIPPGATIVDIGGFDGNLAYLLSKKIPKLNITVIDTDKSGLAKARALGLNAVCGSALDVPLQTKSADIVLCLDILEHIKQDDKVIKEISRLLKTDGKYILTTPMAQGVSFPFLNKEKSLAINFGWGHIRLGYTKKDLSHLLHKNMLQIKKTSGYFNTFSRFIYRITIIPQIAYPFRSILYRAAVLVEPYLKHGVQEHIIIGSKSE